MFFRKRPQTEVLRCSFCNKSQRDVAKLIAGPSVYICIECVEICNQIVADDVLLEPKESSEPRAVAVEPSAGEPVRCNLCRMLWPTERSVGFPDRGWLCQACLDVVREHIESVARSEP
jgi:predicted Rdx family selenoprotein